MYSIVLGLEVLGNPVGFIKGLKDGAIGLFYQPIQVIVNTCGAGSLFECQFDVCISFEGDGEGEAASLVA